MQTYILSGVSVASVDASSKAFMFYSGGILTQSSGCGTTGNYWVALVGYYTTSISTEYWTIQNSWGTGWGQ